MRLRHFLIVAAAAAAASCTSMPPFDRHGPGNPNFPRVEVRDDAIIVVDQEPIFIPKGLADKSIEWRLSPHSRYRFPANGVVVEPEEKTRHVAFKDCGVKADGRHFRCTNDGTPGRYKYTIRVTGPERIEPLDPWIRNH